MATVHNRIRIRFEVSGRRFEAVRLLKKDEPGCTGDEILRRASAENGGAIGDEDEAFLRKHRAELPAKLRPYWLATNRRDPDDSRCVSGFEWGGDGWYQDWYWLGYQWRDYGLVVRRCA